MAASLFRLRARCVRKFSASRQLLHLPRLGHGAPRTSARRCVRSGRRLAAHRRSRVHAFLEEGAMATTCPVGFDVLTLRERIREVCDAVAVDPRGEFHFHRGSRYAVEYLGYDPEEPRAGARSFGLALCGRRQPSTHRRDRARRDRARSRLRWRDRSPNRCAQGRTPGRTLGFDMTPAMCDVARRSVEQSGLGGRVEVREALFESLPVPDSSVDVVISNGVLEPRARQGRGPPRSSGCSRPEGGSSSSTWQ